MITYTRLLLLKLMHVQLVPWQCAPIAQTQLHMLVISLLVVCTQYPHLYDG